MKAFVIKPEDVRKYKYYLERFIFNKTKDAANFLANLLQF